MKNGFQTTVSKVEFLKEMKDDIRSPSMLQTLKNNEKKIRLLDAQRKWGSGDNSSSFDPLSINPS
jgi:hypothetical protein